MKISKVTVTGADDSIDPMQMAELTKQFPFVEWGILVSKESEGRARFPSLPWLNKLREVNQNFKLPLSAHICGSWIRKLLIGNPAFFEARADYLSMFQRYQLNFHGQPTVVSLTNFPETMKKLAHLGQFIFQQDGRNENLMTLRGLPTLIARDQTDVAALFDLSHGAGVLPEKWPRPLEDYPCGYAGGLSPENVDEQCEKIGEVVGDREIWIDAETRLRSDDDMLLDVNAVTRYLQAAKPYVGIANGQS